MALLDRPATAPSNRVYTNPANLGKSDFSTVEVALNRRFAGKWMVLTSFGYTWLNQIHSMTSSTSATGAAGNNRAFYYRPSQLMFGDGGYETSSTWNYKIVGRYVLPADIGFSGLVVKSENGDVAVIQDTWCPDNRVYGLDTETISFSSGGAIQRAFCAGVPTRSSTSMLPVSGAEQLNTSGAK